MLSPSGCTVPNWKISLICSCLRRMLEPRHKRMPRTWTSTILWPAELKCCRPQEFQGCCCVRFANVHQLDSWDFAQFRQGRYSKHPHIRTNGGVYCRCLLYGSICGRIYSTQDLQVKWSRMVKVLLGPCISVRGVMNSLVGHRGRWYACDPGFSAEELSVECTSTSLRLRSRLHATIVGCGKMSRVCWSVDKMRKFWSRYRLMWMLKG